MEGDTRLAVRVVLLDAQDRVLLFEGRDLADDGNTVRFWFTPGGGCDSGESLETAAHRELLEETGLSGLRLSETFHRRELDYLDQGRPRHQVEEFVAARTQSTDVSTSGWTDLERRVVTRWLWWSQTDLTATLAQIYPENLAELVLTARRLV